MSLINNKEKQFVGGNWGHPRKFIKKKTKIANPLIEEIPKYRKKKQYHKTNTSSQWNSCPFCEQELKDSDKTISIFHYKENFCRHCDAKEINECPACKKKIWFRDGIFKHQIWGCGFEGKKK